MSELCIHSREGRPIHSVDEWRCLASPQGGDKQWKDGRSAKELAKAWFAPKVPRELGRLFESHKLTRGLVVESAIAELTTELDDFPGEPRHHDLVLLCRSGKVRALVGVEAKADEEFGPVIQEELKRVKKSGRHSNLPQRVHQLSQAIFGRSVDDAIGRLRYQLLHGLAGTLIEARSRSCDVAVFVVHEFISDNKTQQQKIDRNVRDFERFVQALPALTSSVVREGSLLGPIRIPGGKFVPGDIPVMIGKVTIRL